MLNKEIATKWVTALRSGEYKQTSKVLRSKDNGFCCLGVLCDLYQKETGKGAWGTDSIRDATTVAYGLPFRDGDSTSVGFPDTEVLTWADLECTPMAYGVGFSTPFASDLASQNDDGATFEDIALLIEAQLKEEEAKTNGTV